VIEFLTPYLKLCRVSNLPTVWTNVLAALVLSSPDVSWAGLIISCLSLSLFYAGGMCLNDILDVPSDRIKRPLRPLPAGLISVRGAFWFTMLLFAAGFAVLFLLPYPRAGFAGLLLLALIVAYDKFHKEHPATVFLMAACRFMTYAIPALAVTGTVGPLAAIAGSVQFLYILSLSLVARYENSRPVFFTFPVMPVLLAGISVVDGVMMAAFASWSWFFAGLAGGVLTLMGQKYVKGD